MIGLIKPNVEKYILWILSGIFTAGIIYANIIKIPAIEKSTQDLEIRMSVAETNYEHIRESLVRIERKLDGGK